MKIGSAKFVILHPDTGEVVPRMTIHTTEENGFVKAAVPRVFPGTFVLRDYKYLRNVWVGDVEHYKGVIIKSIHWADILRKHVVDHGKVTALWSFWYYNSYFGLQLGEE